MLYSVLSKRMQLLHRKYECFQASNAINDALLFSLFVLLEHSHLEFVQDKDGKTYFITFIDNCTRYFYI